VEPKVNVCPADGERCELAPELDPALATLLPCTRCRVMERIGNGLRGTRLGQNERRLLLAAGTPAAEAAWPYPGPPTVLRPVIPADADDTEYRTRTRSLEELTRAAARSLRDKGLLHISRAPVRSRQRRLSLMWRTSLGHQLVEAYDAELQAGRPIRWDQRRDNAIGEARLSTSVLRTLFDEKRREGTERLNRLPHRIREIIDRQEEENTLQAAAIASLYVRSRDELDERLMARIDREWRVTRLPTRVTIALAAEKLIRDLRAGRR
jgi:hypothetical protein